MCGLVGVKSSEDSEQLAEMAVNLLVQLQHRGQDGAGISVLNNNNTFESLRGLGLVQEALKDYAKLPAGSCALAHTRYATTGFGGVAALQPFVEGRPQFALAHNGNVVNTTELYKKYSIDGASSDLSIFQTILLREADFLEAIQKIYDEVQGAYACVGIEDNGTLFAFRDPFGLRPLFYAEAENFKAVASESAALNPLKTLYKDLKVTELKPGEWIRIENTGVRRGVLKSKLNQSEKKSFCMFEMVYFSSPQSEMEGKSVYRHRLNLGAELANQINEKLDQQGLKAAELFDAVVPVPETSRTAALAVAEKLSLPYREFLVKNPYIPRTFILSKQEKRLQALNMKLSLVGPEIAGQRILLVDDSVVRGNTSRMMSLRLREAGAKKIYLASTCPKITHGCFYGIDFPDQKELVAYQKSVDQIAKTIEVDDLYYLSRARLQKALGTSELCTSCLTGEYPVGGTQEIENFVNKRRKERTL